MLIYLITNLLNNKKYVGQTNQDIVKRWKDHIYNAQGASNCRKRYPLYLAIRKYGLDAFCVIILDTATSQAELNQKEIDYIRQFRTIEKRFGYNRHEGGNKPPLSTPQSRHKAGLSMRGRKFTPEHRQKLSLANKGNQSFLGCHHSEETKHKMSEKQKENCRLRGGGFRSGHKSSAEHVRKIALANTGKTHSEETRRKISQSKTNPSLETRERLRQSHLGKKQSPETIARRSLTRFLKTVAWG